MTECEGLYSRVITPTLTAQALPKYVFNFSSKEHSEFLFCCCCCFCLEENIWLLDFLKEKVMSLYKQALKYKPSILCFLRTHPHFLSYLLSLSLKSRFFLEYSRQAGSFRSCNLFCKYCSWSFLHSVSPIFDLLSRSENSIFVIPPSLPLS